MLAFLFIRIMQAVLPLWYSSIVNCTHSEKRPNASVSYVSWVLWGVVWLETQPALFVGIVDSRPSFVSSRHKHQQQQQQPNELDAVPGDECHQWAQRSTYYALRHCTVTCWASREMSAVPRIDLSVSRHLVGRQFSAAVMYSLLLYLPTFLPSTILPSRSRPYHIDTNLLLAGTTDNLWYMC